MPIATAGVFQSSCELRTVEAPGGDMDEQKTVVTRRCRRATFG